MVDTYNDERIHVGYALRMHRELLGLTRADVVRAIRPDQGFDAAWTENALDPSELRVRWYHDAVLRAYEAKDTKVDIPFGQREQWWCTELDQMLWRAVLQTRRGVHWWWAPRKTPRGSGALCYLCDQLVHTYDLSSGATHPMRCAVMRHRNTHHKPGGIKLPAGTTEARR